MLYVCSTQKDLYLVFEIVCFVLSSIFTYLHYVTNSLYVLLHGLVLCEFSDASVNNNDNNKWSKLFDKRLISICAIIYDRMIPFSA